MSHPCHPQESAEHSKDTHPCHETHHQVHDEEPEVVTSFLQLPTLIREKVYTYLCQNDYLNIRQVCNELLEEVDNFVDYCVIMKNPSPSLPQVPIPFPYLKHLTIDNDECDLPWKIEHHHHLDYLSSLDRIEIGSEKIDDYENEKIQSSVRSINLGAVSFQTFVHLSHYKSIKSATLTTNVFIRPIPTLNWPFLTTLRVQFVCSQIESFMLDNFDSLCVQHFPSLDTLSIAMCNTVLSQIQSAYSIRILRFVIKHWKTLRSLDVTMEAECCVSHMLFSSHRMGHHMCPGLSELDLADMKKVQLTSLTLNCTELSCPRCCIWQDFIRQQTRLETMELSISCAMRLASDFFCPIESNSTQNLESIVITMWGMDGYYPFDFRHLDEAINLKNLEIVRHSQTRSQLSRPELLNVSHIPQQLLSLTLNGLLISSQDIPILFKRTQRMKNLILIDCGFGLDIGVLLEHISLLAQHPSYATAIIDFNTPVINSDEAVQLLSEEMDKQQLIFQYLFEIPTNKNHRFWFVHPDRVEETNLDKTGYSKDVLLSCDVLSEYTQNFYFDEEFDDPHHPDHDHHQPMHFNMEPSPPPYFHDHPSHQMLLPERDHEEFHQEIIPISS